MTSVKGNKGAGNGSGSKGGIEDREQRRLNRELAKEQEVANREAAANAASGDTDLKRQEREDEKIAKDMQAQEEQMGEMRQVQETFLSMGSDSRSGTPQPGANQRSTTSATPGPPPPLAERSANRKSRDFAAKPTDLTPAMLVADSDSKSEGPFSDNQKVSADPAADGVQKPSSDGEWTEVEKPDSKAPSSTPASAPSGAVSSASAAAKKIEDARAPQTHPQQPVRSSSRPTPGPRQNSSAGMAGVGANGGGVSYSSSASGAHQPSTAAGTGGGWFNRFSGGLSGRPAAEPPTANRAPTGALNAAASGGANTIESITSELRALAAENRVLKEDKRKLTNNLSEQESLVRSFESTIRANENQKRQQANQINVMSRELAELRRETENLRRMHAAARDDISTIDADRHKFATQLSETAKLLESRTLELRTAETFLTKYDDTPGDEVVGIVGDLNAQVLNIAGKVAEDIVEVFGQKKGENMDRKVQPMAEEMVDIIGVKLVNILFKSDYMEDPTPIQLSVQSLLVNGIFTILSKWPFPPGDSFSDNFWKLYKGIHRSEVQPVASRWRALGSKYYRQEHDVNELHNVVVNGMISHITRILTIAGVSAGGEDRLAKFVIECVGQGIQVLWHTAGAFAQKIREHVHSTDYELVFIAPAAAFNAYEMRAQGSHHPPSGKKGDKSKKGEKTEDNGWRVLCTTDLGLRRTTNRMKAGDTAPRTETEVMSKAVVIFEHELEGM